ncbi:undecaprenyldiphospho-muramoylpentapeptide beta-N-acetylglucosaminyltransferase [Zobellia galactanivorans]|uniref:UDP-N-acetylglucosamine--N-acetylmuramyl-(pentapeptide) pyrophosphoryl-undecaprenol N-acetylglucosamine transferase n=1 Tax=Zobellia galactanivorans (strain DSM 12802 / CCUG 47099 / CIP 106680 / NCIMB 13871 / Dsij) TaxID=63186 RepID=F6I9U8_ZOBGA|nr:MULTISPECIES: undecaprenyldiphospho-muramoylpentapeptide beta-N-acetylglucosaminyltransferase [Zobellia]MBU3027428.1 undecaprenyldiphospho-muramoylpentapeptide beta-N-acetylglucosaminyltransferase [Zobellia galactanivorans]MDO6809473.1 undecaprenyldiphospho-muramoylpentapeptide beta-N-acetylglucosaminyltransferase [Zobellia galactanivorans]OWW24354.1 undecaprenyldiphospho-muramoylpentapeptide beta-N- acetylglucosaminyltransferase [Zobellia sp. OII3]CAZ94859.1 UDP-N-acetylglucosamine-N-acetyl
MGNYRFILSGGGTGGHIYPAIAIANELKRRHPDAQFLFVGAKDRMEMEKVPQAGYEIEGLWISGLQRKLTLKNLMFPFKVISSLIQAGKIVRKFKPHAVIGTGGFASGPMLKVASGKGVPCVLQEQNSYAGITNKLLKDKVAKICVAYDEMDRFFPKDKIVKTGNPVRGDLVEMTADKNEALKFFGLKTDVPTLLILGGSLGARRINQLVAKNLGLFEQNGVQLLWQCGKLYIDEYAKYNSDSVKVLDFLNRMDYAYAASDIIISRAGAGSVSELCIVGKPVIFVPSPNVAEDHQTKNARALANDNAALLLKESELDAKFERVFMGLFNDKGQQERLSANIKKLALPNATKDIVDEIEKLIGNATRK